MLADAGKGGQLSKIANSLAADGPVAGGADNTAQANATSVDNSKQLIATLLGGGMELPVASTFFKLAATNNGVMSGAGRQWDYTPELPQSNSALWNHTCQVQEFWGEGGHADLSVLFFAPKERKNTHRDKTENIQQPLLPLMEDLREEKHESQFWRQSSPSPMTSFFEQTDLNDDTGLHNFQQCQHTNIIILWVHPNHVNLRYAADIPASKKMILSMRSPVCLYM